MTSWVRARFWIGCHTMPGQQHIVSPLRLRWVENVRVFRCKLPPAHLAEWPGYFTCYCGDTGVERTPNKSQHTQLTMEKKILHSFLPRLELATFRSRVRRSYRQAFTASRWQGSVPNRQSPSRLNSCGLDPRQLPLRRRLAVCSGVQA